MANKKVTGGRTGAGSTIGKKKPVEDRTIQVTGDVNKMNQNARKYTSEGMKQLEEENARAFRAYKKKVNALDTDRRNLTAKRSGKKIKQDLK